MLKRFYFCLFLFFCFIKLFSQNELKIKLLDGETKEPISFATVGFVGTNRGIVADYDGNFRLPFSDINNLPNLRITALGYKDLDVAPKNLDALTINTLKMFPQAESLDLVILDGTTQKNNANMLIKKSKKISAKQLVERAISKIPKNLDGKPHSLIGYYRDYQLVNNEYFNLNEGILEQFDGGILTNKLIDIINQNAFYQLKQNTNFKINNSYSKSYDDEGKYIENAKITSFGGNELSILQVHDPIRNYNRKSFAYVYKLNENFIPNHKFSKQGFVFDEDNPIVNITFETDTNDKKNAQQQILRKKKVIKYKVSGNISISLKDYSIHGFTYIMYDSNQRNPLFNLKIEYKEHDGNMYLNYISFNNRFVVTDDFIFREEKVTYNKEKNYFDILFNNSIGNKRLKKRFFKLRYDKNKIIISDIKKIDDNCIRVYINDYDQSMAELEKSDFKNIELKVLGIEDVDGRSIYESQKVTGYQFREFFVQEIFKNKMLDMSLQFSSKETPLLFAPINSLQNKKPYIVNSPLANRRMNSKN